MRLAEPERRKFDDRPQPLWRDAAVSVRPAAPGVPRHCERPGQDPIRCAAAEQAASAPCVIHQSAISPQHLLEAGYPRARNSPGELMPAVRREWFRGTRPSSAPGAHGLRAESRRNGGGLSLDEPVRSPFPVRSNSGRTRAGGCRSTIPRRRRPDSEGKTSLFSAKTTPARAETRTGFLISDHEH